MPQLKKIFTSGIMQKDADERLIPDGQYRHAENINIINSETSENAGAVKNVLSNKKLTNFSFTGTVYNITPKPLVYEAKNRIYWLCKDDVGCYLLEYNINNKITTPVLVDTRPENTRVLKLDKNFLITGIDILKTEDENKELILWTDNNMQPCCVNISRAKTWAPNSFDEEDILLIKKPPRYAPKITPTYTKDLSNNLEDKFLSFSYRYKYLDGEYSALSSFSNYSFYPKDFALDFFTLVNKGMINKYNAVNIEFNTGDKRVIEIQIVVKESNSNTLYIVETLNKKNLGFENNKPDESILFSNQKIYQALPENELYRAFDNVPLKAKAQTLVNNYIAYANYLECFDIKNIYNNNFKLDYDVSLNSTSLDNSNDLEVNFIPTEITGKTYFKKLNFNTTPGIEYKKNYVISFYFEIKIEQTTVYVNEFTLQLSEDYPNLNTLVLSQEFISLTQIINQHFIANYNSQNEYEINSNYSIHTETSIVFAVENGVNTFTINPIIYTDTANTNALVTMHIDFETTCAVSISSISNTTSCKSNQGYQVVVIYLDKYNRASTVQTSKNNTIFIPQKYSIFKNKLRVTLNSLPPIDADRYKFAIKTQHLQYQTIFINEFYNEGNFVWAKLESDNKDKVKVGDNLILKTAKKVSYNEPKKVKVLDIKSQNKDFIIGEKDKNGNEIIEPAGVYMKIRPEGFSMDLDDYKVYESKASGGSSGYPIFYLDLFTSENNGTLTEISIGQGSSISIYLRSNRKYNDGWVNIVYSKDFFTQKDYNTLEQWFNEVFLNGNPIYGTRDDDQSSVNYAPNLELVRGSIVNTAFGGSFAPNPTGKLYLKIKGLLSGGSKDRNGYGDAKIIIRASTGIYVFETENKQADDNIFYETEETFDIVNGEHHGSEQHPIIQEQDNNNLLPAIIELDFFNCYTQGNGVESYRVKDEFNTKYLNIDLRPSTTSIEPYKQIRRFADITHSSEPYNESSNINGLNNFNLATANFKELDKQYGSIQVIWNKLNDILVIQEEKAGKILFGKQAIYTAEGEPIFTKISEVLGDYSPYQGNNGIGLNPESFAQDNFRFYWFNSFYGTPIRLSIDGTTEINNGMQTYFRNNSIAFRNSKKIGAFDAFNKLYTLSLEQLNNTIDVFNCGNSFQKVLTAPYEYILKLNNQIGDIELNYNVLSGSVTIETTFDNTLYTVVATGTGTITIPRNNLDADEILFELTPNNPNTNNEIQITNVCPIPTPLDIVLVVLGDELDNGKTIQNRFRANLNSFLQYEDTFGETLVTKLQTISGFEGQGLFPVNGDTITIESVKRQSHTGNFFKTEETNQIKYLVSDQVYNSGNIESLLTSSTNIVLTETIQGINQNTFTGSFVFNRNDLNKKLYLIWDYTNKSIAPIAVNDNIYTNKNQVATLDITANDITSSNTINKATVNLDITSLTIVNNVTKTEGVWSVSSLGVVTFTPALDFVGTATITYNIKDSQGLVSNNATITAQVDSGIIIFDADHLVLTYNFTDGQDLDTRTRIVTPNVGQNTVAQCIGWGVMNSFPTNGSLGAIPIDSLIDFAGDNTGTGLESILINIDKIKTQYPEEDTVVIDCRAFWYNTVGTNNVNLKAVFYKGGAMIKNSPENYKYTNPTAIDTLEYDTLGLQIPGPTSQVATSKGYRIATFTYTISTGVGVFDLEDVTTPEPST